jgi:hypothetical protein
MQFMNRFSMPRLLSVACLATILLQPALTLACGVGIVVPRTSGADWSYGNDSAEQSFIDMRDGTEKLIISRNFTDDGQATVWVIPIPAQPTTIQTDILDQTPRLVGSDIIDKAHDQIPKIKDGVLATQLYPLVPKLFEHHQRPTSYSTATARGTLGADATAAASPDSSVVVYDHLEKSGMVTEVLSAGTSDDLYAYLTSKGLTVTKDAITVLQGYIGQRFSFVASWVLPAASSEGTPKGLEMTFPAKEMFYPLKPGSVYAGAGLPETINVIGHVTPKLYANIKKHTEVNYFDMGRASSTDGFVPDDQANGFTRITITVPPPALTEDLRISATTPVRVLAAQQIENRPILVGILLFILISLVSTYLAAALSLQGVPVRSRWRGFGLLSLLGIVGAVASSVLLLRTAWWRRGLFVAAYSGIFVGLTILATKLLSSLYS